MIENASLPTELIGITDGEKQDFVIKAKYSALRRNAKFFLIFGLFWLTLTSLFVYSTIGQIIAGKTIHYRVNKVPHTANLSNLGEMNTEFVVLGVFSLIGIGLLSFGVYSFVKKGGYFVATPTRLISYESGMIRSMNWDQFTGNSSVIENGLKGRISLELKTGKYQTRNKHEQYVPDVVYIIGIQNAIEVEQLCRKRIIENNI